jgi:uncharacterized Tic20 family protein
MSDPLPPVPPSPPAPPAPSGVSLSESQWALAIHLSALFGFFGPGVLNIVGPLVIWLLKRPESRRLDEVGKRVLNFQISYAIYFHVLWLAATVLTWVLIGFLLYPFVPLLGAIWLGLTIFGAIRESNDEPFAFPFVIHFLK